MGVPVIANQPMWSEDCVNSVCEPRFRSLQEAECPQLADLIRRAANDTDLHAHAEVLATGIVPEDGAATVSTTINQLLHR